MTKFYLALLLGLVSMSAAHAQAQAQAPKPPEKPKMVFMGAYDGGQPGVSIYKLFDPTEDVVCYVLTPDIAGRKKNEAGVWLYEGNSAGSISCVKVKVLVVPVAAQAPPQPAQTAPANRSQPVINKDGTVP